jgi:pimeloyl-ACP methyl ester carboxylesterase
MKKWIFILLAVVLTAIIGLWIVFRFFMNFTQTPAEIQTYFESRGLEAPVSDSVEVDGRKVHYVSVGADTLPWVVWVHGSPGTWDAWIKFLADSTLRSKYHQVAIDRLGYGGSDPRAVSSLALQAEAVAAVLKTAPAGTERLLLGHSFGGPVVVKLAMIHPELVDGFASLAGFTDPELEERPWLFTLFLAPGLNQLIPPDMRVSNEEIHPLKGELETMRPDWSSLTMPSAWVQGDKDVLVKYANLDYAEKMLPEPPMAAIRLKGENHFIPWTQFERIKKVVDQLHEAVQKRPQAAQTAP